MLTISNEYLIQREDSDNLHFNFNNGFSSTCFDKLIQHKDLYEARNRMLKRQNYGALIKEWLSKFQKITAGNIVKAGTNHLGKDVYALMVERRMEKVRAII